MAVGDSVLFDVDMADGASTAVVPAVAGKRVRVWRAILTFDGPVDEKGTLYWDVGGVPTEFFVASGDRTIMGYEALAWATGEVGEPLTLSIDADISVKGSIRAEYLT